MIWEERISWKITKRFMTNDQKRWINLYEGQPIDAYIIREAIARKFFPKDVHENLFLELSEANYAWWLSHMISEDHG